MPDFRVTRRRLTQGRPSVKMTVAARRFSWNVGENLAQSDQLGGVQSEQETLRATIVDVHALARQVYDLMKHDLRIERVRHGRGITEGAGR